MSAGRLLRLALGAGSLVAALVSLWLLAHSPFAAPFVQRGEAEARLALERAMAREITPDWLLPRIDDSLATRDLIALESYLALAERYDIDIAPERAAAISALHSGQQSFAGQARLCAACAWDIEACDSLKRLASCALPVELTPVGDLNALRRAGTDWATGAPVDRIELGLASLGLGASAAILVSGGTSAVAKLGATSLRLSRRMGTLTPGLTRVLRETLPPVNRLRRGDGLEPLGRLAGDLGAVRTNTSLPETLLLMRHVDSAQDAARLARLSAVAGSDTRPALLALGKARAFRTLVRLSDLARATIAALAALVAQLAGLALSLVLRRLRRQIARTGPPRRSVREESERCASSLSF